MLSVLQVRLEIKFYLKLRLCSANHRAGYFSNLACDWPSTVWSVRPWGIHIKAISLQRLSLITDKWTVTISIGPTSQMIRKFVSKTETRAWRVTKLTWSGLEQWTTWTVLTKHLSTNSFSSVTSSRCSVVLPANAVSTLVNTSNVAGQMAFRALLWNTEISRFTSWIIQAV